MSKRNSIAAMRRLGLKVILASTASAASLTALLASSPASAQAAPAASSTVAEVVVTARKKAENLQNVPLTVTAVTNVQLKGASATSLQDISFLTSGLVFSSNGAEANEDLVVRGIGDTSGGEASATNVSVFLDGVYIANPSAVDLAVDGVERVEVVEGPVSGLYGRNAFAGAINYVTEKPTNTFHYNIAGTYGEYNKEQVDGGISGPLIDGILSGRLAGTYDTIDGTYHDKVSGQYGNGHDRKDWIGTLLFTPNEHITSTAVLYDGQDYFTPNASVYYKQNCAYGTGDSYCGDLGNNQIGPFLQKPDASGATGLTRNVIHFHEDTKLTGNWGTIDALFGFNKVQTQSFSDFDGTEYGILENLYNAANTKIGVVAAPNKFGNTATENDSSIDVRYDSPASYPLRVSVGGFYLNEARTNASLYSIDTINVPAGDHLDNPGFAFASGGQPLNLGVSHQANYDVSGFIGAEYDILPTLTLATVVRDTSEEATEDEQSGAPSSLDATFRSITSNESLTWKITPNYTAYLAAANGSKAGGFNGAAASSGVDTYQPETDWNYELGLKTLLLDGHLRAGGDIYHLTINNVQQIGPQPGGVGLVVANEGSVAETGVEVNFAYAADNGFKWSGGLTYSPARYVSGSKDYSTGAYSANDVTACSLLPGCAARVRTPAVGASYVDVSNLQLPNSSDLVANTSVEYRHPLGVWSGVDWFVRGDYRYESKEYANTINNAWYGPRNIVNLHAGLDGGKWNLTAYVLNLLDDKTPVDEQANAVLDFDGSPLYADRPPNVNAGGVSWIPTSVLPDGRTFAIRLEYKY